MTEKMALPSSEVENAANLLRSVGWIVTPPAKLNYGCFCDLFACEPGTKPDGCVIDEGRRHDCVYASKHKRKEQCEYWKAWTPETLADYWEKMKNDD